MAFQRKPELYISKYNIKYDDMQPSPLNSTFTGQHTLGNTTDEYVENDYKQQNKYTGKGKLLTWLETIVP